MAVKVARSCMTCVPNGVAHCYRRSGCNLLHVSQPAGQAVLQQSRLPCTHKE
jgi:hypothetical protein